MKKNYSIPNFLVKQRCFILLRLLSDCLIVQNFRFTRSYLSSIYTLLFFNFIDPLSNQKTSKFFVYNCCYKSQTRKVLHISKL
jgi:hypothetical protein